MYAIIILEFVRFKIYRSNRLDTVLLLQKNRISKTTISCQIRPPEFVVINEFLKEGKDLLSATLKDEIAESKKLTHLRISFENEMNKDFLMAESTSESNFTDKLFFYNTLFPQNIEAFSNGLKQNIAYYHFERNFGLGTKSYALIGLELNDSEFEKYGLTLKFKPLFSNDTSIEFAYPKGTYNKLPKPKIEF